MTKLPACPCLTFGPNYCSVCIDRARQAAKTYVAELEASIVRRTRKGR